MTEIELRHKIDRQLSKLSPNELSIVSAFLDSLHVKDLILQRPPLRRVLPIKRGAKAGDLLKFAGTWQGNDLEECLRFVDETRSRSKF